MPNWVKNNVKVIGTKKELEFFLEKHIKKNKINNEILDFETIIPMPENIFRGNIGIKEEEKHGRNNWYDWSIENWGTKWNSCDGYLNEIDETSCDKSILDFSFSTAWACPYKIYSKLAQLYPNLIIEVDYADEDIGNNCGIIMIDKGKMTIDYMDGNTSFSNKVWGWDHYNDEAESS
jgi:hypothetical protein